MKKAATAAVLGIAAAVAVVVWRKPERRDAAPAVVLPAAEATVAVSPAARAAASTDRERSAAADGIGLLAAAGRAQAVLAGVVSQPAKIDAHGWRADLRVDSVLLGDVRLGDVVTVGWEELSAARQVRFADGQRVLVVLDPLPTQSIWRKRFPAGEGSHPVLVVASGGDAFLARPDGLTVDGLQHYLAMGPSARNEAPGARRLAELVRGGYPTVAREALAILEAESVGDRLDADAADSLLAAARSSEREPSLRGGALRLAARHRLPDTRETALALTEPSSPVRVDAFRALAMLPDGLPAERVEQLLTDPDPELRTVGVELAGAHVTRERLVGIVHDDPAPTVRLAAGHALVARAGNGAIPDVIGLLDDPDTTVRTGMAESIGDLGEIAVGPLSAVVDDGSERAALAAVLGLSRTGKQGALMLASIAKSHDNKAVQAFAKLALGEAPGHED